jgi:hypothetical protein
MPISPVIEALRIGRDLIETHGLARGTIENYGKYCTIGAITRQSRFVQPWLNEALDYLAKAIPSDLCAIPAWNDAPDRTSADVIAAYDRAIDLATADALAPAGR